jgi:hypothetical protein
MTDLSAKVLSLIRNRHYSEIVHSKSKTTSLLLLAATAVICSRTVFAFINDPEGPNLIVVLGLAALIYLPCLTVYLFNAVRALTSLRRNLLAIFIQLIVTIGFYLILR